MEYPIISGKSNCRESGENGIFHEILLISRPDPMRSLKTISLATRVRLLLCVTAMVAFLHSGGQICTDPVNVIYGLTNAGTIHPIDVNTGVAGAAINPAYSGNAPDQSNGIGYNNMNGKFYYFKRIPSSSITEFVSFDPATNTYSVLSSPATTSSVYSGSIAVDGLGYYCWDTQGKLFYYKFSNNTWTTITSSIVDQFGKDVDSIIRLHSSGDGAIDGSGNLWILPSSNTRYGLFRLSGPLPTTPVASVTVQQIVAMTVPPARFVGISFNSTGQIFMVTSSDKLYRLEDNLSLTLMSTLTISMGDLTSCNFPMAVLIAPDYHFTASVGNNKVKLSWTPSQQGSVTYTLERSTDNRNWHAIANGNDFQYMPDKISYADEVPLNGRYFYRIRINSGSNHTSYSIVRVIDSGKENTFYIWPNPVSTDLYIRNSNKQAMATIFNATGYKVGSSRIDSGLNSIDLSKYPSGKYIITIQAVHGRTTTYKLIKK